MEVGSFLPPVCSFQARERQAVVYGPLRPYVLSRFEGVGDFDPGADRAVVYSQSINN